MISLRVLRRLEMVKMLSIRRFQKLLGGYFIIASLVVLTYLYLYGNDNSAKRVVNNDSEISDVIGVLIRPERNTDEVNVSMENGNAQIDQYGLIEKSNINDADDIPVNLSASAVPEYFLKATTYTEDYNPTSPGEQTSQSLTTEAFNGDDVNKFALDMNGAVYQDLLANYEDESLYEIPHILHQTWDTEDVPVQMASFMSSWSRYNPFWVHWFWTDRGFVSMLLRHFPEYYDIYRKHAHKINRADMRKYFLLYKEGGVIADLDLECVRRFDDAIMDSQCILAREPEVHAVLIYGEADFDYVTPSFMACRPGHPFLKFVIDNLRAYTERTRSLSYDEQILNGTGTMFLSEMLHEYRRLYGISDIYIAPSELFMPAYDPSYETRLRVKCNGYKLDGSLSAKQRTMCEGLERTDYRNYYMDNAYTYHHWSKPWTTTTADTVSVRNVLQTVAVFNG